MPIVTVTVQREANVEFFKSVEESVGNDIWTLVADVLPVKLKTTDFAWLGDHGVVKHFKTTRTLQSLKEHAFNVTTKKWEYTISWEIDELNENKDIINPKVKTMGYPISKHYNTELFEKLVAGTSGLCFDGTPFFGDSHPVDETPGVVNDNLVTGTGTTAAQIQADFDSAKSQFMDLKVRGDLPMWEDVSNAKYVIFASSDSTVVASMTTVFNTPQLTGGATNIYYNQAKVVHTSRLSGDDWYLFRVDTPYWPLYMAEQYKWKPEWDFTEKFKKDHVSYGGKSRFICMYGFYHSAMMINN